MKIKVLTTLLAGLVSTACNIPPSPSGTVEQQAQTPAQTQAHPPASESRNPMHDYQRGELLYNTLVAELAARRGQLDTAYDSYMAATDYADSPVLVERAARIAVFAKAWEKAVMAGERWLAIDPDNLDVRHILASSYMRLKDEANAITQFNVIIEDHPDNIEQGAAVAYALLKHESNQTLSLSIAKALAVKFSFSPQVQFNLARLSVGMGETATALDALDNTLALKADYHAATLLKAELMAEAGESADAFDALRKALEQYPDSVALNLGYAQLLIQSGQGDLAVAAMHKTQQLRPGNASVLLNLGRLALEARRLDHAKAYFADILPLGQRTSEAHYYLARIADSQRQYDAAINHYNKVSNNDLQFEAQTRITELLALQGHIDQARLKLERLRELNPGVEHHIHLLLVENKILRETGHHQEAFNILTRGLETYPDNVDILYARALVAERIGHEDIFEEHLRAVLKIEPNNAHALNALGYFLADRSLKLDEAERYIRQAIALEPTDPAIIDSLGWVRYRQGDVEEALTLLRQAYDLLFDPEVAAHLGEVLWVSGDQEQAKAIWNEALQQNPEDTLLKGVIERFRE